MNKERFSFFSKTDTEVLMAAYDCLGVDCLQKLYGVFSFALFDSCSNELFCSRVHFSEKAFHFFEKNVLFCNWIGI
jgi:asparagine synthase (glutamine-hydrolysing)